MEKVPCYDCTDRHPACHSECEKYLGWHKRHVERKQQEAEERRRNGRVTDFTIKQIEKRKRR